jgi:DNA-binding transcriptional MerR regulator
MANNIHEFLREVSQKLQSMDYVKPEAFPNIDLYMDQVTTFMDTQLSSTKRSKDDKILTKTMINNYTKNNLLPPPTKKKYSNDHVLTLIFIYYFKNILSISDIQHILNPITERYFGSNGDTLDLQDIYNEVFGLEYEEIQHILKDLAKKYKTSLKTFADAPKEEAELLQQFAFICMLSFDVYMKKMIIEQTIDKLPAPKKQNGKKKE